MEILIFHLSHYPPPCYPFLMLLRSKSLMSLVLLSLYFSPLIYLIYPDDSIQRSAILNRSTTTAFSQATIISCPELGNNSPIWSYFCQWLSFSLFPTQSPRWSFKNTHPNMLYLSSGSPMSSLPVKNNKVLTQSYQDYRFWPLLPVWCHQLPPSHPYYMPATIANPLLLKYDNRGSVLRTSLCLAHPLLESDSYLHSFPYSDVTLDTLDLSFPI